MNTLLKILCFLDSKCMFKATNILLYYFFIITDIKLSVENKCNGNMIKNIE